jgi:hypothetical protein
VVRPSITLAYFHVVASQWTRVALNPFQVIQWSTWIPRCSSFLSFSPVCEESPQLGASRPYNWWSQRSTEVREGRAMHTRLKSTTQPHTQVTTWALSSTHGVLNSRGAQVASIENQMRGSGVWMLRNDQRMLGCLLHAPRGPFYSPKAARSRWRHSWKANLAFCRVAHRTVRCATGQPLFMSGAWFPSIPGTADRCNFGLVGAPDTVRCPQPTVGAGHASPADYAADRCDGDRWLTGQSGAPPDSPVNYSRTSSKFSWEWPVRRRPAWRTGHCPVHHQTVRCARLCWVLAAHMHSLPIFFFSYF